MSREQIRLFNNSALSASLREIKRGGGQLNQQRNLGLLQGFPHFSWKSQKFLAFLDYLAILGDDDGVVVTQCGRDGARPSRRRTCLTGKAAVTTADATKRVPPGRPVFFVTNGFVRAYGAHHPRTP